MQTNSNFILRNIGDLYFIFPKNWEDFPVSQNIITTNETGAYLWNQLQTDTTPEALVEALSLLYNIDTDTASNDIHAFLLQLRTLGALAS